MSHPDPPPAAAPLPPVEVPAPALTLEPAVALEPAAAGDAAAVVRLRDAAASWLLGRGLVQWEPGEASVARFAARADAGELFVVRDRGEVVAAVVIVPSDPQVWGSRPGTAGYLHTLVIDRRRTGQGLGRRVLALAEAHIAAAARPTPASTPSPATTPSPPTTAPPATPR